MRRFTPVALAIFVLSMPSASSFRISASRSWRLVFLSGPGARRSEPGRGGERGRFGEAGGIEGGAAQGLGQGANPPVSRYES